MHKRRLNKFRTITYRRVVLLLMTVLFVMIIDQITKLLLPPLGHTNHLPIIVSFAGLLTLIVAVWYVRSFLLQIILAAMVGAGSTNVLDRVQLGHVRDTYMIQNVFFNTADIILLAGVFVLVVELLLVKRRTKNEYSLETIASV